MGETVDALVVGAYAHYLHSTTCQTRKSYLAGNYGSGKRGGGVSTIICAVLDDRNAADTDDDEPKQATFSFLLTVVLSSFKI